MKNLLSLFLLMFSVVVMAQDQPNIVVILADDMGYGEVQALLMNENEDLVFVDSDGLDDEDPRDYLDVPTESLTPTNSRLRMYFSNSSVNNSIFKQLNFTVGQEWQSFTFDFDGTEIPQEVVDANGYDRIKIGFANVAISEPAMTYYIDAISGTTEQVHPAAWLAGSWGVTFPVFGGERLNAKVAGGYDLPKNISNDFILKYNV